MSLINFVLSCVGGVEHGESFITLGPGDNPRHFVSDIIRPLKKIRTNINIRMVSLQYVSNTNW